MTSPRPRVPFLCVARFDGARWESLCLDLDIAVEGTSFEDVKSDLHAAIASYVADASREAEPARSQLLHRRAPLRIRLAWGLRILLSFALDRGHRDRESTVGFPVSCPA